MEQPNNSAISACCSAVASDHVRNLCCNKKNGLSPSSAPKLQDPFSFFDRIRRIFRTRTMWAWQHSVRTTLTRAKNLPEGGKRTRGRSWSDCRPKSTLFRSLRRCLRSRLSLTFPVSVYNDCENIFKKEGRGGRGEENGEAKERDF